MAKKKPSAVPPPILIPVAPVHGSHSRPRAEEDERSARLLVTKLEEIRKRIKPSTDPAWNRAPALRVIDCVLSLNRNYDRFLVPRLEKFEKENAQTITATQLCEAISSASAAPEFVKTKLDYRDPARAITLFEVSKFCADKEAGGGLEAWAREAKPAGHVDAGIRGFGIAGWQYLRMLFGGNTTKPDVHIIRFVERATGRERLSPMKALVLLEEAARITEVPLRDLDTTIWEESARPA